jgi:omega-6 fatty acid desaturase (delta-12 desaturase)
MAVYIGPYMVVNSYLTIITFLQHTDAEVPHYDETAWTWLKGALATVDRNYPPYIDALQHYIGTTHVVHHIFSDLPHYNAKEAHIYMK